MHLVSESEHFSSKPKPDLKRGRPTRNESQLQFAKLIASLKRQTLEEVVNCGVFADGNQSIAFGFEAPDEP